jgi:HAD superfamily hydrolase (TIGR01509 family)
LGEYSDSKAIVLDIDGTLCSLTQDVGTIYHELLRSRGLESDGAILQKAVRRVWGGFRDTYLNTAEDYRTTHDREREVWLDFVRRVCAEANLSYGADPEVVEFVYNSFASRAYRRVEAGASDFLHRARQRGFTLVAASNNDVRSKVTIEELGLGEYFTQVVVAGDLGWKKPSPNFYAAIAENLRLDPHAIVHVGNDRELDVEAAQRYGFRAVLYAPKGGAPWPSVSSFNDLGVLIGL